MKRAQALLLVLATAIASAGAASAEELIELWDNYLEIVVDDDFALTSARGPGYHSQAADDFGLSDDLAINRIIWKGTWVEDGLVDRFRFLVYEDRGDGAAPTGGPGDPTQTAIDVREVTFMDAHQGVRMENGMTYYWADVMPIDLVVGPKYWLAVQAIHDVSPPPWGWTMLSYDAYPVASPAVWGYDSQYWQFPSTPPPTLQFRLVHVVPEPCTLALFACGLLGLMRRR